MIAALRDRKVIAVTVLDFEDEGLGVRQMQPEPVLEFVEEQASHVEHRIEKSDPLSTQ